ncbi:hypothetical protein MLD38_013770 [Melastoma candidum]|uniref:Uncharacterized protein n=1 Tax=Melastoma candidum TaxID=119954 RepID=A0ACB9REU0_9MYRT|nr:hypothetical protein MLD38_013770 [Melastoma candidum]
MRPTSLMVGSIQEVGLAVHHFRGGSEKAVAVRDAENTLWTGVPGNYANRYAPEALSTVGKLVDADDILKLPRKPSNCLANPRMYEVPPISYVFTLLGDIKLEFDDSHLSYDPETYKRELDLDSAMVTVKYNIGNVTYPREHFASCPDQAVAVKISTTRPGSVSFKASLDSKLPHLTYAKGENKIVMEGSCPG